MVSRGMYSCIPIYLFSLPWRAAVHWAAPHGLIYTVVYSQKLTVPGAEGRVQLTGTCSWQPHPILRLCCLCAAKTSSKQAVRWTLLCWTLICYLLTLQTLLSTCVCIPSCLEWATRREGTLTFGGLNLSWQLTLTSRSTSFVSMRSCVLMALLFVLILTMLFCSYSRIRAAGAALRIKFGVRLIYCCREKFYNCVGFLFCYILC